MVLKFTKPITPSIRHRIVNKPEITSAKPKEKSLLIILPKSSGRNSAGKITVRHRGGRQKRFLRKIDFKREKRGIPATVVSLEYDPNRGASIALVIYEDGKKHYIIAPEGLKVGSKIIAGEKVSLKVGNALPLRVIPIGMFIHNLELKPGRGGQIVRGAGAAAVIRAKEDKYAIVELPSKELRKILLDCFATIGKVSNVQLKNISLGKAGRKRLKGIRPAVRGVAMHPGAHPHGGGEGRSGIGMPSPKSPWGKKTLGKKTRKKGKYSDKYIVKRRG